MASKIKFKVGQKIYHKFYGKGEVRYIGRNEQDELYYEVAFPRYGKVVTVMNEKDMVPYSDADEKIVNGLIANMIGSEYHGVKPMDEWSDDELNWAHDMMNKMTEKTDSRTSLKGYGDIVSTEELQKPKAKTKKNDESVNHPSHYNTGSIEVIDFIEDLGLDIGFCLGNAIKYISRAGKKDKEKTVEDIKKAQWYLSRWLDAMRKEVQESMYIEYSGPRKISVYRYIAEQKLSYRLGYAIDQISQSTYADTVADHVRCIEQAMDVLDDYVKDLQEVA